MNKTERINWFAGSWLGQLLASTTGRGLRILAGLALIGGGLVPVGGTWGMILAVVGLVPLLAGVLDVCLFSALFRGPFRGQAIRALRGR